MALTRRNVSSSPFLLGASTTATLSHNHPVGSNWIFVILAIDSYSSVSDVTYNGVSMTLHLSNASYYGGVWQVYKLDASALTGTHDVVVSGLQAYDYVSVVAYSFSDASGIGIAAVMDNTPATSTNDKTFDINIAQNSMIIANGWNGASSPGIYWVEVPDNTVVANNYGNQMYGFTWGGCSDRLSAGSYTCAVNQNVTYAAIIFLIEVKEAVTATLPTVITTSVTNIGRLTATGNGEVTSDGGATVDMKGMRILNITDPAQPVVFIGSGSGGVGAFSVALTPLLPGKNYQVAAYAHNSVGYAYGEIITIKTDRRIIII